MKDFYSERLKEISAKRKETARKSVLPLMRPEYSQGADEDELLTLAGNPNKPKDNKQQIPDSMFKGVFDEYNADPSFKAGMDELLGTLATMREETKDLGLPEELIQKRVEGLIGRYEQQAMAMGNQMPDMQGAMGGLPPQAQQAPVQQIQDPNRPPMNPQQGMPAGAPMGVMQ